MNVDLNRWYKELDRGDGVCKFFDCESHLCKIYDTRPIKCNVDLAYNIYFKDIMTKERYYQLNYNECQNLKKRG